LIALAALATIISAQPNVDRANYINQLIDQAVNPSALPAGYGAIMVGYLDDFGKVYKGYGKPTVDGTVALNEKTIFGVGSLTKMFTATLLAIANTKGLALNTPLLNLMPGSVTIPSTANRYGIRLIDLADHHAGLPKNEGHLFNSLNDLYSFYSNDPITCNPATSELIHDCGCCDPVYMGLLGLAPTCGAGVANPVYSCPTHKATTGAAGWVYSNLGFELLGNTVATWMGYNSWNNANLAEITQPLAMSDTIPLESFNFQQVARSANHCDPSTRATNINCQLLDWLPVGNPGGGLFSTADDMLKFASYNAYGTLNQTLAKALPIVHQQYEKDPKGGQELGWETISLVTGELERWKDGSNGPFNAWIGYTTAPLTRAVVLFDKSGSLGVDLGKIGSQILIGSGPSINSVTTANGGTDIAQNTWIVIKGHNLVPAAAPAAGVDWSSAPDFAAGNLPTKIANVSVTVNGKPAFVYFYCSAVTSTVCSLDQINVLSPLDTTTGDVKIVVTNQGVASAPFTASMKSISPAFLQFSPAGYVVATHVDGSLLGPANLYPGLSTPAHQGESIVVYGVGFGLPNASVTNGASSQFGALASLPDCQIGGKSAPLAFAGLISPGLYQFNMTVPAGIIFGDNPISCTYQGASTPAGNIVSVQ
jgi:uncharacterized protein (TIGR03437 family)